MGVRKKCSNLLCVIFFVLFTLTWAQDPTPQQDDVAAPTPQQDDAAAPAPQQDDVASPAPQQDEETGTGNPKQNEQNIMAALADEKDYFIKPVYNQDDRENIVTFYFGKLEYLVINYHLRYIQAKLKCEYDYRGTLAIINDNELKDFLGEALSETNIMTDSLWIGGIFSTRHNHWRWTMKRHSEPLTSNITELMVTSDVRDVDRRCLAFARVNHTMSQFHPLNCDAYRGYICSRPHDGLDIGPTTHPGWIKYKRRLYKIFSEHVPWDAVEHRCFYNDPRALPAVVRSNTAAQILGRYLLIGRPSLENAWIGARFHNHFSFQYVSENIMLKNETVPKTGFPPWRGGRIRKPAGCILLDRHLDNMTYFVEARCARARPYICYKKIENETENVTHIDIIWQGKGYRLHFAEKTWNESVEFCLRVYAGYNAKLAEPADKSLIEALLYVMGENRTTTRHIWIGGRYNVFENPSSPGFWYWISGGVTSKVNIEIINNQTMNYFVYDEDCESRMVCLNMDRENHIEALIYGTLCDARQNYICEFSEVDLKKLQQAERDKDGTQAEQDSDEQGN